MPKPHFIGLEIEEAAFGAVMHKLEGMQGIIKFHWNLDSKDKKAAKPNGHSQPRGQFETTGQEAVADILNGKPPMTTAQLRDVFKAQGRSPASIASVLHTMKANGELKLTDDGYTLTKLMRDRLRHRKGSKKK